MTADHEVEMSGTDAAEPTQGENALVQDPSSTSANGGEERASKRLKMDDSGPDAPVVFSDEQPRSKENGAHDNKAAEQQTEKPNDKNGETAVAPITDHRKGVAPIKQEYLIMSHNAAVDQQEGVDDDDAAEGRGEKAQGAQGSDARDARDSRDSRDGRGKKDKRKQKGGQNVDRSYGHFDDAIRLCSSRAHAREFSPEHCKFGDKCRMGHDLRKYMEEGRRGDLEIFDGKCPIFETFGKCSTGWKCRFVKSHMREIEHEDGRKELILTDNTIKETENGHGSLGNEGANGSADEAKSDDVKPKGAESGDSNVGQVNAEASNPENAQPEAAQSEEPKSQGADAGEVNPVDAKTEEAKPKAADPKASKPEDVKSEVADESQYGVYNIVSSTAKFKLSRKQVDFAKTEKYIGWSNGEAKLNDTFHQRRTQPTSEGISDLRAQFVDPPFKPSEKRRLYFGPETPALAPLTTQGNLPFRRLCIELGAELTYSEMAMGMPLVQGNKNDWTLMKAHESELKPPKFNPTVGTGENKKNIVVDNYDHSRDIRFGAQISGSAPWVVTKAADILNRYCPHLRLIDLNCGCPIDMVYKTGGGSALLESGGKLERMIRSMNAVSGEVPITAKIRTGVKNNRPTAQQIIGRLAFGGREHRERLGAPGCAAVTLHGRSREQRYTKKADWGFIADCAALIDTYNQKKDALTDTAAEPDPSTLPNTKDGKMYFLGNGDCYSHVEYFEHIEKARVDSVMIGRGALIKPWLFEEIEKGQYLDKSASERLTYIEKFVRYGLEAWGSDELGVGYTRRFLLEWLSFSHRYVPIGLLERLPPDLNERPPAYHGRNDMETLMASKNYLDWVKISEMFLGPVHPTFQFQPKHKSNSYEAEG